MASLNLQWKDATSYSRGDTDRRPTTWAAEVGPVRLVVTCSHLYYKGRWVGHIQPFQDCIELDASSAAEAQAAIVGEARKLLEPIVKLIGGDEA